MLLEGKAVGHAGKKIANLAGVVAAVTLDVFLAPVLGQEGGIIHVGLEQITDASAIESVVDEVIAENGEAADKVRSGNIGTIGFLVGQVMKKSRGQANPKLVNELLRSKLGG